MPEFADNLFDQYPLPPPPEAQPSDLLGAFFGAAPDRTKSYAAGLDAGSQYRLRSAQGEKALEEAHMQREQRMGEEMKNSLLRKVQSDPNYQPTPSESIFLAKGAADFSSALGNFQEQGFRRTLADPNAPQPQRFASGEAIQGHVLPQTVPLGTGRELNVMTQTPETNAIGTSDIAKNDAAIGADNALADLRHRTDPNIRAGGAGGAGARLPAPAMKIVDEATQSLGAANQSESLADSAITTLAKSGVNLGMADNTINRAKNFLGAADPPSMAYASVQQAFEKLRNNYLLLAKGVQTEGDATRAWNSEIGEAAAYDNALATQQLERAKTLIDMQRQLQHRRIEGVFTTYGVQMPGMYNPGAPAAPPPAAPPPAVDPAAAVNPTTPAAGNLTPAEQAELDQLRREVGGR